MTNPLWVIAGIAAIALVYVLVPVAVSGYARFRKGLDVVCPEEGQSVHIGVTGASAAFSHFRSPGHLTVAACPLWPDRKDCAQHCVRTA
jgi:hypothetical protein